MIIKILIPVIFFVPLFFYTPGYSQNATGAFNSILKDLNSKSDTSNFNPRTDIDVIAYKTSPIISQAQNIKIQNNFIYTSGFPIVNVPQSFDKGHSMPKTFDEADALYKNFKQKESDSPYLEVFEQDAASLIIRRFLLDKAEKNNELQYYTEELLKSHSPDYGLLYLAIKQLKPFVGEKKVSGYKIIINSDTVNLEYDKKVDSLQKTIHDNTLAHQVFIKAVGLAQKRKSFYIHKIDSL